MMPPWWAPKLERHSPPQINTIAFNWNIAFYADGGIGYISVEVHVERDEKGKITRYYGANQDITERKKAGKCCVPVKGGSQKP